MLSILVPCFEYDCSELLLMLNNSGINAQIPFEIICIDDGSVESLVDKNKIDGISTINFIEQKSNIGRSQIRNKLAKMAHYPNLLFIDGDQSLINDHYIKNYIPFIDKEVVYGGRIYPNIYSNENDKLHWQFGISREAHNSSIRNKKPHLSFASCNFMIQKSTLNEISFQTEIENYGYEDLMLAFELKRKNIPILHIENPLVHNDIISNDRFLHKTDQALKNLIKINLRAIEIPTRAYLHYRRFLFLNSLLKPISGFMTKYLKSKLIKSGGPLFYLDLYKWFYLIKNC